LPYRRGRTQLGLITQLYTPPTKITVAEEGRCLLSFVAD
jgi:hypothetical protein